MKKLIKLVLIIAIIMFALYNYRVFSFKKGFSKTSLESKSFNEFISKLTGIEKVEYYSTSDSSYKVYILTNGDAYLVDAKQEDIDTFSTLGIFSKSLKPEKFSPIPFYFEIIACIVILFIPIGKKKKQE